MALNFVSARGFSIAAIAAATLAFMAFAGAARADDREETSPEYCGGCHTRIFEEWKSSAMGSDQQNPHVVQLYKGLNGLNEPDGMGYQGAFPGKNGDCADCHVPALVIDDHKSGKGDVDLAKAFETKADHGISCQFCHTTSEVHYKVDENGHWTRRIFDKVTFENGERKFGPRAGVAKGDLSPAHETVQSDLIKDSALCGACHLNQEEKVLAISTYADWLKLKEEGKTTETCQTCHMPLHEGPMDLAEGSPKREGVRSHAFPGASDPAMLRKAVDLKMDARIENGQLVVATVAENVGAGHPVPGSGPIRNVILKIDAVDSAGKPLEFVGDEKLRLPPLAGFGNPQTKERDAQDWAGMPGRFYSKVLKGFNPFTQKVQMGVPGFVADEVAFDTSLRPGAPDKAEFRFAVPQGATGEISVRARLVYRWTFKPMADSKKWTLDDRLMRELEAKVKL